MRDLLGVWLVLGVLALTASYWIGHAHGWNDYARAVQRPFTTGRARSEESETNG